MLMKAIVAVDKNWGIGREGGLLTALPEDMKFFRTTTRDGVVIMGRKTLESFPQGKPLKNRVNVMLTANPFFHQEGVVICRGVEEIIKEIKQYDDEKCFVIGGQSVYEQLLPYCDTAYVTYMKKDYKPDTYFPRLDEKPEWELVKNGGDRLYEGLHFEFRTYQRKSDG